MRPLMIAPFAFASVVALAARSHADPSLPAGWIAGGPSSVMAPEPAPSRMSREAMQIESAPPRPALAPAPIDLAAYDVVDVPPTLTTEQVEATNDPPPGDPPAELFVDRDCGRASVRGHAVGMIQVGWASLPIAPQSGGGVSLWHVRGSGLGDGKHLYARALWETIDHLPDGTLRYAQTVARFNVHTCKARLVSTFTAVARPALGGLAYLFRTRCAACGAKGREDLHVILPSGGWGTEPYAHSVVALGQADSVRVRGDRFHLDKFGRSFAVPVPLPPVGYDMLIGVEAVRGLGESRPSVIGYASAVRHVGF